MKFYFPFPRVFSLLVLIVFVNGLSAQTAISFVPSDSPVVFSPGIVSDGFSNRDFALAPDGNDFFYTMQWGYGQFSVILHSRKSAGKWSKPDTAWFSGRFNDLEPAFSPDGNRLFFTSNRPLKNTIDTAKDYDIWYFEKKEKRWEGPFNAGPAVNSERDEFYPSISKKGNLYFTRDNGDNKDDIFICALSQGQWDSARRLPEAVNSPGYDFNAFVDPDENYILFTSYKRSDDFGGGDLYYSLKKNAEWQPAIHLGAPFNSRWLDYSPFVSADRQYFVFTSKRQVLKFPFSKARSADQIRMMLETFGNGNDDIYIVRFSTLEKIMEQPH